jgi:hypothetical protein
MIHELAGMVATSTRQSTCQTRSPKTKMEQAKMNQTIAYCKPYVVILGSVAEMIRGTHIKGHTGIIEAIHWRINPAYDLDE